MILKSLPLITILLLIQKSAANTIQNSQSEEPKKNSSEFPWEKNLRIPETTLPYHYDLYLHPDLETKLFSGRVSIKIGVLEPMDYLLTHVKKMNVTSTVLVDESNGNNVDLLDAFEYKINEFWVVRTKNVLKPGNYSLDMEFNGDLAGHITGFYISEYTNKNGEKKRIATSKFQPTDARGAFPCFDEPSFKSTFTTTLVRPSYNGYIALSNMPVKKETPNSPTPWLTTVEFEKSVPMVTYLACFIVCDFDYVEKFTNDGKPFRVYATKDQISRANYSLNIGVSILNYYENYFGIKYPLPKQDMIAIPDFISGAMEHWGLITYRETNLLYDNTNSSSYNRQRVASVVSHELAHMWFGNLVTLKWWDDLWLNEGFASYIEYKGVDQYHKDWNMIDQFLTMDLQSVFKLDQTLTSHPIVQEVNHPNEITEIFDAISYSKGASVLRMLEDFLGPENFRKGVSNFITRFTYKNAVTQDLWDDLQAFAGGLNITRIMDTWTRQMGFPVVYVQSTNDSAKLQLTQERFLVNKNAESQDDSPYGYKWDVPITYKTNTKPRTLTWLNMEEEKLTLTVPPNYEWIKFNVDEYGYYRVNYDDQLWDKLIKVLNKNHLALSTSDRSSLVDDSFTLASSGHIPYNTVFRLLSYLENEEDYVPWDSARGHLNKVGFLLESTPAYTKFREYCRRLVDKHVGRLGFDDVGTHTQRRNRVNILGLACKYGHAKCLEGVVAKFKAWIQDPVANPIHVNLRSLVYGYGIKATGEKEWNVLFERYLKEVNAQEKRKMIAGLSKTSEPWIATRLIHLAKNESVVRRQDFLTLISRLSFNPGALCNVWSFVRNGWPWLVENFGLENRYLGRTLKTVMSEFTTETQLQEVKTFLLENPAGGAGTRARTQGLENINENINWIKTHFEPLHKWLLENIA